MKSTQRQRDTLLKQQKQTAIEMLQDIRENILRDITTKLACDAITKKVELYSSLDLMKISSDVLLNHGKDIRDRNNEFFPVAIENLLEKIVDIGELGLLENINFSILDEESEETLWCYMDTMFALASQYKKTP